MSSNVESYVSCPSCHNANDPSMSYCTGCGYALSTSESTNQLDTTAYGFRCTQCGKYDRLNDQFCIHCGAKIQLLSNSGQTISLDPRQEQLKNVQELGWRLESKSTPWQIKSKEHKPTNRYFLLNRTSITALIGIVFGFISGLKLVDIGMITLFAHSYWPRQGLVIYVTQSCAQVIIEDSNNKKFSIGQLSADGTLSLSDLAPGHYRVQIEAPGYQSIVQFITIERNRPTILGFPEKISLPKLSSEPIEQPDNNRS